MSDSAGTPVAAPGSTETTILPETVETSNPEPSNTVQPEPVPASPQPSDPPNPATGSPTRTVPTVTDPIAPMTTPESAPSLSWFNRACADLAHKFDQPSVSGDVAAIAFAVFSKSSLLWDVDSS